MKHVIFSTYCLCVVVFLFLHINILAAHVKDDISDQINDEKSEIENGKAEGNKINVIDDHISADMSRVVVGDGRFEDARQFNIDFSGALFLETFYDSRQIRGFTQDAALFYPLPRDCDNRGLDINNTDQFSMIAVRINGAAHISGPNIGGAKTSALIKGGFEGLGKNVFTDFLSDLTVRLFRLEKGIMLFEWEHTKLLMGHFYHPLVLNYEDVLPDTISSSKGVGYDPYAYAPQVAIRHRINGLEFVFVVSKLFRSQKARWAVTPDLFIQVNGYFRDHIFGAGINYRVIVPNIEAIAATSQGVTKLKETAQLGSVAPFVFTFLKFDRLQVRSRLTYIQNGREFNIMGGQAVLCRNPITNERFWTNLAAVSFWTDIHFIARKNVELGLFTGITKNVGSPDIIQKGFKNEFGNCEQLIIIEPLALTVADYMFAFTPRIRLRFGNFTVGGEIEYSRASFAQSAVYNRISESWSLASDDSESLCDFDCKGKVINACPVNNFRLFVATSYEFA